MVAAWTRESATQPKATRFTKRDIDALNAEVNQE
jgi:hypothetical protein